MIEPGAGINQEQPVTAGNSREQGNAQWGLLKIVIKSQTPGKNNSARKRESKNW